MKDFIEAFHDVGIPYWMLFGVIVAYAVAKELHVLRVFDRPATKSDRELLSMDEKEFRQAMLEDRRQLRQDLAECDARHVQMEQRHEAEMTACEARYSALEKRFTDFLNAAQVAGLDLLMKIAPARPGADPMSGAGI